jgi:OmpA-OmpF porin, OOP family
VLEKSSFASTFRFRFGRFLQASALFLERRIMKKLNKVASLFATAALAVSVSGASAQNWVNSTGLPWKGTGQTCWRDTFWAPANATVGCDGAPVKAAPAPAPAAAPAPVVAAPAAAPVAAPAPAPAPVAPPAPVSEKVTFAADAFYDTGKSVLKSDAKAKLDDLVEKTAGVNLEVIIAVGHTDSDGSDAANQKLSVARAESVKKYLVSKGVEANRVYTEGKGEKQPVADNKTKDGKMKNRRVEIEVVGTRTRK